MSKFLLASLLLLTGGCVSLPGADQEPAARYSLHADEDRCVSNTRSPLSLSVIKLGAGLNTDRLARRDSATGEFTYLQGVRWVDNAGAMLEQSLASGLECMGHTVITSHHAQLDYDRLVCEVRALNLVLDRGGDSAELGLSCVLFNAGGKGERVLRIRHENKLRDWSASAAIGALTSSYQQVLEELAAQL